MERLETCDWEERASAPACSWRSKKIVEREIDVSDYVSISKLSDYVINPYVGCPHACRYCYASFMRRFTNHNELWGDFLDVKRCSKPLGEKRLSGKSIFMSTVTDCYNPLEAKYKVTRRILEELAPIECELAITTKSNLVLRDLDLLAARTRMFRAPSSLFGDSESNRNGIRVLTSLNTHDDGFRAEMDCASTVAERIGVLKACRERGIPTTLFVAPIFPYVTDFRAVVEPAAPYVDEIWFDKLNLRPGYKADILAYIRARYPKYYKEYLKIYEEEDAAYWRALKEEIADYCFQKGIRAQILIHS